MAFDYFIGWTQKEKIDLMRGLQKARLTGQIVKVQTSSGVYTEFDPNKVDNDRILLQLQESIANSDDYDSNDPVQAACAANKRPGITRPQFC